jgi:hypothetical protein
MMKGTVLAISSDPTGNCLNGTRGIRRHVISLEGSESAQKK